MQPGRLEFISVADFPLVQAGDDLAGLIMAALERSVLQPNARDVLVIAQKVVSKAENRYVDLAAVEPSMEALALAREIRKDARLVEVILSESRRVVRHAPGLLIVEHRLGFVMANAGVDQSNVAAGGGQERVLLLPQDPDASAERLRSRLSAHFGCEVAIVISDSFGRAWREGTVAVAIGAAGLPALVDLRGAVDLFGRVLQSSTVGYADQIAAGAALLMGEAAEARPVVLLRGLAWSQAASTARSLLRAPHQDLFR